MPSGNTLLDYGIAINFFGNYKQEASAINNLAGRLNNSLMSLQQLVIGGGIVAGMYKMTNALLATAKSMEQNFANLKSTLGSATKAIETLEWARKKGASTPFEIQEVNDAVGTMTTMGFNKNDKMREEVFNSIGDFAALKGFNFSDMMQRVAKATFGNWESLGDQFGVRKQTIGGMVKEQVSRTPEKFKGEESAIQKAIQVVEKGKQGTEEYKMAVVKLIGVLGRGGMINRLETIEGAWSNVNDLMSNFMMKMVGYSQEQGTLANAIKNTIVDKILKPFSEAHEVVINGTKQMTTSVEQLGRIGQGVGNLLTGVWDIVDSQIGKSSNMIKGWIDKLDAFFADYKNNVAPIILFIALVKIQIEEFLRGFVSGFKTAFGFFIELGLGVWEIIIGIAQWFGIGKTDAESFGKVLGLILGTLLGIKAFKLIISPFVSIWGDVTSFYGKLKSIKTLISVGEGWSLKDSVMFRWMQLKDTISSVVTNFKNAIVQAAKFGWTMLTNVAKAIWSAIVAIAEFIVKLTIQTGIMLGQALVGITTYAVAIGTALWSAIVSATTAVWSFTVALLANPITWIVIAVIALVVGIVLLIKNWDKVKEAFIAFWNWTIKGLKDMWEWVKDIGRKIGDFFAGIWDWIKQKFSDAWNGVKDIFTSIWDGISSWFMDKVNSLVNWFKDAWSSVKDFFGFGDDEEATITVNKNTGNTQTTVDGKLYTPASVSSGFGTTNTTKNVVNVPAINIYPAKGQSNEDIGNSVFKTMQNQQGKAGK